MATINILSNKMATASSYVSPFTASRANNGTIDVPSRWLARITTSEAWITIDAGAVYYVNRWVAKFMGLTGWGNNYNMSNYTLQSSVDGSAWTVRDTVVGNTSSSTDRTVATFSARYFRMSITAGPAINPKLASVVEFEVYSAPVLTALAISAGTLTSAFAQGTNAYTATVPNSSSSITVTPTAGNPVSAIAVNGTPVTSGQASAALPLVVGANTITINVTEGTVVNTYTIIVTRQVGVMLSGLTVQSGSTIIALTPSFGKTTMGYTASVASNTPSVTFTPTAETAGSTIKINDVAVNSGQQSTAFPLNNATNNFNIVVTANGASTTYTVAITKAGNLILNQAIVTYMGRTISTGTKTVGMNQTDLVYSTTVPTGSQTITVAPSAQSSAAIIKVNNNIVVSGSPSSSITLNTGSATTVTIVVSSQDGSSNRNYTLNITIV